MTKENTGKHLQDFSALNKAVEPTGGKFAGTPADKGKAPEHGGLECTPVAKKRAHLKEKRAEAHQKFALVNEAIKKDGLTEEHLIELQKIQEILDILEKEEKELDEAVEKGEVTTADYKSGGHADPKTLGKDSRENDPSFEHELDPTLFKVAGAEVSEKELEASKHAKTAKLAAVVEESKVTDAKVLEEYNILSLFEGVDVTDDFKVKVKEMFESVVLSTVNNTIKNILDREYDRNLTEQKKIVKVLSEKVDKYIMYVVEEWLEENKLAIESSLKVEHATKLIDGLKGLLSENYIEVPEEKKDLIKELSARNDELEKTLNETLEKNVKISETNKTLLKKTIVESVAKDLTDLKKEKLHSLAETIQYDNPENFEKTLVEMKNTFLEKGVKASDDQQLITETAETAETKDETSSLVLNECNLTPQHEIAKIMAALKKIK